MNKLRVAIVGLGFGAEFIPIYQKHPNTECYAICQRNSENLNKIGDAFGIEKRYKYFDELLDDKNIDAVHINTPIAAHSWMSLKSLKAGKHTACTVPMATTVKECLEIMEEEKKSGKVYMMMETAVYTREFLYVKDLLKSGKIGKIQFMRGSHQQNMGLPGWPNYWYGFPPMHYSTHAIGPLLELSNSSIESVICHGSGTIDKNYSKNYNSPYAVETALLKIKNSDLTFEVTRSLFNVIRQYRESFDIFGTKMSFEWEQIDGDKPVVFTGHEDAVRVTIPDYGNRLPKEIAIFTRSGVYDEDNEHASFIQGSGHGGSHPHLVHEFISSILEEREALVCSKKAANLTTAGICAHESAMQGGARINLPIETI